MNSLQGIALLSLIISFSIVYTGGGCIGKRLWKQRLCSACDDGLPGTTSAIFQPPRFNPILPPSLTPRLLNTASYSAPAVSSSYSAQPAPAYSTNSYSAPSSSYSVPSAIPSYSAAQSPSYLTSQAAPSYNQQSYASSSYQQQVEPVKISFASSGSDSYGSSGASYGSSSPSYSQPQQYSGYNSAPTAVSMSYDSSGYGAQQSSGYGAQQSTGYGAQQSSGYGSQQSSGYGSQQASTGYSSSSGSEANASILRHNQNIQPGSSHQFDYATSNGIEHSEITTIKQVPNNNEYGGSNGWGVAVKSGQYRYTSPEGQPISLTYDADEQGFKPKGAHLPVAPADPNAGYSPTSGYSSSGYMAGTPSYAAAY
ncbi:Larval cuticle protein LCP-17 [Orchesella cincta]|uniref:Larval cuticle protein LCP-17 n=1 Tax=Orchesella cincta TaxID=48709 RepID=A0A1D2NDX6_ORCCI|nr:Larval cuticle protein LCP-17 [Orchesella cincta]